MQDTVQVRQLFLESIPNQERCEAGVCRSTRAPSIFGIFFSPQLEYAFNQSEDAVYLHSRCDGGLFNVTQVRAMTKVQMVLIRGLLFADNAALTAHTEAALQRVISCFARTRSEFGLTISVKKTNIMGQDASSMHSGASQSVSTPSSWWKSSLILAPPSPATSALIPK